MTEAGMILSNPLDGERRPGSVGLPMPGVQVRSVPLGKSSDKSEPEQGASAHSNCSGRRRRGAPGRGGGGGEGALWGLRSDPKPYDSAISRQGQLCTNSTISLEYITEPRPRFLPFLLARSDKPKLPGVYTLRASRMSRKRMAHANLCLRSLCWIAYVLPSPCPSKHANIGQFSDLYPDPLQEGGRIPRCCSGTLWLRDQAAQQLCCSGLVYVHGDEIVICLYFVMAPTLNPASAHHSLTLVYGQGSYEDRELVRGKCMLCTNALSEIAPSHPWLRVQSQPILATAVSCRSRLGIVRC